jgi:uncharacterized OB-fold protein
MNDLVVSSCEACGWQGFPQRVWCPRCGAFELTTAVIQSGTVTELSVLEHAIGRDVAGDVLVANVELQGGGSLIARLEEERAGSVGVFVDDGTPVATELA